MASDEQLIADLTASLRQALNEIESDAGFDELGSRVAFDEIAAKRVLHEACTRLATIQPKRAGLLLPITVAQAERFSSGMADLLCWARGFMAARPDDTDSHPMGVDRTRNLRLALIDAIAEARGEPEPGEMPF